MYSEEVSRCVELVFSLLHVDLPACTLALLLHLLPRLLAGIYSTIQYTAAIWGDTVSIPIAGPCYLVFICYLGFFGFYTRLD